MEVTLAEPVASPSDEIIINYHSRLLREYGTNDARVVWNSRFSQEQRFEVLMRVGDLNDATILDVGCGLGDFSAYLSNRGVCCADYRGIDINSDMLEAAREKYPDVTFESRDILEEPFDAGQFDFVFESGIFNLKTPNTVERTFATIDRMVEAASKGVAMNFVSRLSGNSNPDVYYWEPSEVVVHIENYGYPFALKHDYRSNDFTVLIHKS